MGNTCKHYNAKQWDCFCSFGCDVCWANWECTDCGRKFADEPVGHKVAELKAQLNEIRDALILRGIASQNNDGSIRSTYEMVTLAMHDLLDAKACQKKLDDLNIEIDKKSREIILVTSRAMKATDERMEMHRRAQQAESKVILLEKRISELEERLTSILSEQGAGE